MELFRPNIIIRSTRKSGLMSKMKIVFKVDRKALAHLGRNERLGLMSTKKTLEHLG